MHYLWLVGLLCMAISGCTRFAQPETPLEQEEQEQRMRVFLENSSPRNMNDHPKVTPEFTKVFNTKQQAESDPPKSDEDSVIGN